MEGYYIVSLQAATAYHLSYTFSDDAARRIEDNPEVILTSGNIHCYTNAAAYGNMGGQDGVIQPNACVWFDAPFRPFDFVFKNNAAGSNAKIVIIGTLALK